jgi:hypothetical protein
MAAASETFTGEVGRALGKLKRFCGVQSIRQNYKGTGTQAARRQLWVRLKDGRAIDVWLDAHSYRLGGVTTLRVPGCYLYNDLTPAQVANAIAQLLQRIEPA